MLALRLVLLLLLQFLTVQAYWAWETGTNTNRHSSPNHRRPPPTMLSHRRHVLEAIVAALLPFQPMSAAGARDLFQTNPLTNPLLEQFRIWDQAEADAFHYGGELERGNAGNKGKVSAYPSLLVPILDMVEELQVVEQLVRRGDRISLQQAHTILKQAKYDKVAFKKAFNRYSDNVYYSDPDRANLYLAGGATPRIEQSLAYLLRNDILTNLEALQAEVEYLLTTDNENDLVDDDLRQYAMDTNHAMQRYLELVPPKELQAAQELRQVGVQR